MTLVNLLALSARKQPKAPAVVCSGLRLSYAELAASIAAQARNLKAQGVGEGDRVAISLPNSIEFMAAYYGAMALGAVAVPFNPGLRFAERERILNDCEPVAVVDQSGAVSIVRGSEDHGLFELCSAVDGNATAAILYTSGSTGEPKGVMLSGESLSRNALAMADAAWAASGQVHLVTLPLFHSFGATVSMNMPLLTGGCCVLASRFVPAIVAGLAREFKAAIWAAVPAMYAAMAQADVEAADLSSLKMCISGGASLSSDVRAAFEGNFGVGIFEGYGLTEASPVVSASRFDDPVVPGSAGKPLENVEVRLEGLYPDGAGELWVRAPSLMQGYWRRPELTAAALVDGWLRTGDIACIDEQGRLHIVDRVADVINSAGYKVYPAEVEAVLRTHPAVDECLVVGEPHPVRGEAVLALVELRSEAGGIGASELMHYCRQAMAAYKVPNRVEIVDGVPRNDMGKPVRRRVRGGDVR